MVRGSALAIILKTVRNGCWLLLQNPTPTRALLEREGAKRRGADTDTSLLGELGYTHFGVRYIFAEELSSILLVFMGKELLAMQAERTVIRKNPRRLHNCERARHDVLQSLENELGELASEDGGRGSRLRQELKCVWKRTFAYGSRLSLTIAVI